MFEMPTYSTWNISFNTLWIVTVSEALIFVWNRQQLDTGHWNRNNALCPYLQKNLLHKICCFYFVMAIIPSYPIASDQKTHKIKSMDVIKYTQYTNICEATSDIHSTIIEEETLNSRHNSMLSAQCSQEPQSNQFIQCYRGRNQLTCNYFIMDNLWHLAWYVSAYFHFISFSYGLIWLRLSLDPIAMSINKGWNDKSKIHVTRFNKKR